MKKIILAMLVVLGLSVGILAAGEACGPGKKFTGDKDGCDTSPWNGECVKHDSAYTCDVITRG